jgi:hypothetical protein
LIKAKALLSRHKYPDDLGTVIVAGFIDTMLEHHEAMLILAGKVRLGACVGAQRV